MRSYQKAFAYVALTFLAACTVYTQPAGSQPAAAPPAAGPAPAPVAGPAPAPAPAAAPPAYTPTTPVAAAPVPGGVVGAPSVTGVDPPMPANQPPVTEVEQPSGAPIAQGGGSITQGKPPSLKSGAAAGYYIWRDPDGWWHLRTTTGGGAHRFRGRLQSTTGTIVQAKAIKLEAKDRIVVGPKGAIFAFDTVGGVDGFDFRTSDNGCATFVLRLDGGPVTKRIVVGQYEKSPGSGYFTACP